MPSSSMKGIQCTKKKDAVAARGKICLLQNHPPVPKAEDVKHLQHVTRESLYLYQCVEDHAVPLRLR